MNKKEKNVKRSLWWIWLVLIFTILLIALGVIFSETKPKIQLSSEDGLISYYKFENDVLDNMYNNNGINNGGVFVPGVFGTAIKFNGNDSYVNLGLPSNLKFTNPFTISVWVNHSGSGFYPRIFGADARGGLRGYRLYEDHMTNKWVFGVYNGSAVNDILVESNSNISLNQWVHLAGVFNGTNLLIYVNGTLDISKYWSGVFDYNNVLSINIGAANGLEASPNLYNFFNGTIDELRIYNRSLNIDEIRNLSIMPVCSNFGSCTATKPQYCDNGVLVENCTKCGCDSGENCNITTELCSSTGICVPATCQSLGKQCGNWSNGCGANLSCASCGSGNSCNSAGLCVPNFICSPNLNVCSGKQCGNFANGTCGSVSCGTCSSGETCSSGTCVEIVNDCGNGICDSGEKTSCPEDCKKSRLWIWILILVILILVIIGVIIALILLNKKKKTPNLIIKNY